MYKLKHQIICPRVFLAVVLAKQTYYFLLEVRHRLQSTSGSYMPKTQNELHANFSKTLTIPEIVDIIEHPKAVSFPQ